jgi:hypothetical protein
MKRNRGYISLILVILISFSLWSSLYEITDHNSYLFNSIKNSRIQSILRSSVLLCKNKVLQSFMEDIHADVQGILLSTYFNSQCRVTSLKSEICKGVQCCATTTEPTCTTTTYGELKTVTIQAEENITHTSFKIVTLLLFLNQSPFIPLALSTKRI